MHYLTFSISITFISWIVGMIFNALIKDQTFYNKLSSLNFIKDEKINTVVGLKWFKWIVKNTFFKYFNQKLKVNDKSTHLGDLRKEMTVSEISHLIGFGFVTLFAVVKSFESHYLFALTIMIINVLMNLYPSLLQQENKRRIDKLIRKSLKIR